MLTIDKDIKKYFFSRKVLFKQNLFKGFAFVNIVHIVPRAGPDAEIVAMVITRYEKPRFSVPAMLLPDARRRWLLAERMSGWSLVGTECVDLQHDGAAVRTQHTQWHGA